MARRPSTISLMRRGGTLIARASAFWLSSMGFKNSSSRISPGVTSGRSPAALRTVFRILPVVVVDNFDIACVSIIPAEANPPLAIDPDAPLAAALALQWLKPVRGRYAQVLERARPMQHH